MFGGSGSSDRDGAITGYRWDFTTDGLWDTQWLPKPKTPYAFNSTGNYTVTLQVKDDDNATATNTTTVTVSVPPNETSLANVTFTQFLRLLDRGLVPYPLYFAFLSNNDLLHIIHLNYFTNAYYNRVLALYMGSSR
jgi:hypothetical protein